MAAMGMSDHPRLDNLRTTPKLFREATSSFASKLPTFLILSILLFAFWTAVQYGGFRLTSFIDQDPSLKALFVDFPFRMNAATILLFLYVFLSAANLFFVATYSIVLGIVFSTVVNDLLERFHPFLDKMWEGSRLGLRRLFLFVWMRCVARYVQTQLLGIWCFREIEDEDTQIKLHVRLTMMPYSLMSPRIRGYEEEISKFLIMWSWADAFVAPIFAVGAWVAMAEPWRTRRDRTGEGWHLISTMVNRATQIMCFQAFFCGLYVRGILARVFGTFFAGMFNSALEVYFMVAWLMFYFATRCRHSISQGEMFGRRELMGLVDGRRS